MIESPLFSICCSDIVELAFFVFRGLEEVKDFGKFRNLQIVWLNGNKVSFNTRLSTPQLSDLILTTNSPVVIS